MKAAHHQPGRGVIAADAVLERAADLIAGGWTHTAVARAANGIAVGSTDHDAVKFSIAGAFQRAFIDVSGRPLADLYRALTVAEHAAFTQARACMQAVLAWTYDLAPDAMEKQAESLWNLNHHEQAVRFDHFVDAHAPEPEPGEENAAAEAFRAAAAAARQGVDWTDCTKLDRFLGARFNVDADLSRPWLVVKRDGQ